MLDENLSSKKEDNIPPPYYSTSILPFIYLWATLLLYVITSMHIQVITRFFSSQPTVYWFACHLFINSLTQDKKVDHEDENLICTSCLKKENVMRKAGDGIYLKGKQEDNYERGDEWEKYSNGYNKIDDGNAKHPNNEKCSICLKRSNKNNGDDCKKEEGGKLGYLLLSYFTLYGLSGIILFAIFFPPA